jgi:hypothetical protein
MGTNRTTLGRRCVRMHVIFTPLADRSGSGASMGTPKQGDAPTQFRGSGAPHQLAIAAAVVCVVLLGGIGFVNATSAAVQQGTN